MKTFFTLVIFASLLFSDNAFSQLANLNTPESIVYDPVTLKYYISCVGTFDTEDGKIVILNEKGELENFMGSGLVDPKGMVIVGRRLFIADVTNLVIINIDDAMVEENMKIIGANFLNDVCSDGGDVIYLGDMLGNKIYKYEISKKKISALTLKGAVSNPNGLYYDKPNNRLIAVAYQDLSNIIEISLSDFKVNTLATTTIPYMDGITRDRLGNYYVSAWEAQYPLTGKVYRFNPDFSENQQVIQSLSGPADIYFNQYNDTLAIPNMQTDKISFAYYPSKPGMITRLAPLDNAENYPQNIKFEWERGLGALKYQLQLSYISDFGSILYDMNIPGGKTTSFTFQGLEEGSRYYWRIRAGNNDEWGEWSSTGFFKTSRINSYIVVLNEPANNSIKVTLKPVFKWSDVGADSYELQLSANQDFSDPKIENKDIKTNSLAIADKLDPDKVYYWKVRAVKSGQSKDWSAVWNFRTLAVPNKPALEKPDNSAENLDVNVEFQWTPTTAVVDYYSLELSKNSDMSGAQSFKIESGTSYTAENLEYETNYYWQVSATNEAGTSERSEIRSFKTKKNGTSVDELFINGDIKLYPNPVGRDLTVRVELNRKANLRIGILNELGCRLSDFHFDSVVAGVSNLNLDLSSLPQGIYFLEISADGLRQLKRLVVIR